MHFSAFASTAAVFAAGTHAATSSSSASPSAYTPYINFNTVAYITETVSAYTTYFSAATQLVLPDTTYTITEPTTLTLTNGGPFTVVRPLVAQTIVAGCATCYATAPMPFATPSLDANGTSVGTALLKTTATATATPSSSSSASSSSKQAHATTTKPATTPSSAPASSKQGQQQSQSGETLTLPSLEPSAAGGAVTADTLAPAPTTATAVDAAVSSSVDAATPAYTGAAGRVGSSSSLLGRAVSAVAAAAVVGLGLGP